MNDELRHRRVWLRREVIPQLEQGAARDLVEVLARQAELLRDDNRALDELASTHDATDAGVLARTLARARPPGRTGLARSTAACGRDRRTVLAVARGDAPGGRAPGRRSSRAGREPARARARRRLLRRSEPPVPVSLPLPGRAEFGGVAIEAWIEHAPPVAWPDGRTDAVVDADVVGHPAATIRAAEPGERFHPFGRGGSKLVRDALAEAGVAAGQRPAAPIVVAGEPIWVVGYRIDHRVRVTARTRRFLWLHAEAPRAMNASA